MASEERFGPGARCHIVLVPGFGGFDALGRVEYYASVTGLFQQWLRRDGQSPVVLHYFDNLPAAAVVTRAARLRRYLAKRIARGEIFNHDRIVLVGHSTGGLDIRRLIYDLAHDSRPVEVDGGLKIKARDIRARLDGVVFLSVPHWGTNIANWVSSRAFLRKIVIGWLRAAFAGSQVGPLGEIEAAIAENAASLTGINLLLALRDALAEANPYMARPDPSRIAGAQEAASELELYFRQMATNFRVIEDLASRPVDGGKSPAHFDQRERTAELALWKDPPIRTLSYATVGGRPFPFASGCPASVLDLTDPRAWFEIAGGSRLSAGTDVSYRLCYRACAGGPLHWPALAGRVDRALGPAPPQPLELWDNDGIVNTASMLWPGDETVLVLADHLDIVGHYRLRPVRGEPLRANQSYDSLRSVPPFSERIFRDVWKEIFFFAAMPGEFARHRQSQMRAFSLAAAAAAC